MQDYLRFIGFRAVCRISPKNLESVQTNETSNENWEYMMGYLAMSMADKRSVAVHLIS